MSQRLKNTQTALNPLLRKILIHQAQRLDKIKAKASAASDASFKQSINRLADMYLSDIDSLKQTEMLCAHETLIRDIKETILELECSLAISLHGIESVEYGESGEGIRTGS